MKTEAWSAIGGDDKSGSGRELARSGRYGCAGSIGSTQDCQSKKGCIPQPFLLTFTLSGTPKHASQAAKDGSAADPEPHAHTHE